MWARQHHRLFENCRMGRKHRRLFHLWCLRDVVGMMNIDWLNEEAAPMLAPKSMSAVCARHGARLAGRPSHRSPTGGYDPTHNYSTSSLVTALVRSSAQALLAGCSGASRKRVTPLGRGQMGSRSAYGTDTVPLSLSCASHRSWSYSFRCVSRALFCKQSWWSMLSWFYSVFSLLSNGMCLWTANPQEAFDLSIILTSPVRSLRQWYSCLPFFLFLPKYLLFLLNNGLFLSNFKSGLLLVLSFIARWLL